MKKKVCLFEQHLNSIRQNGSRSALEILKTPYKSGSRASRKISIESPQHLITSSWVRKAPNENLRLRNYSKQELTSNFSNSPTKTSKICFERGNSNSKKNISIDRSFTPANFTTQKKSLSFFGSNVLSPNSAQKSIFLASHQSEIKVSPCKPCSTTMNQKHNGRGSNFSFEQLISSYLKSSTKYLDRKQKSISQSNSKKLEGRGENKIEESNLSFATFTSTNSGNRLRSVPRSNRNKQSLVGHKSAQAEIDLLFGHKQNLAEPVKPSNACGVDNKRRNSLLGKINRAVTKSINLFTKFNLFEEAETEEFDNPKYREYMEDVVHCEYITTKLPPHSKVKSIEKGTLNLMDREFEAETYLSVSINGTAKPFTEIDLPIISERQKIDNLADSLIESSIYGTLKEMQFKSKSSKENMTRKNTSNQKSSNENLQVANGESTNSTSTIKLTLFAIFDGHGGNQVSIKAKEILPREIHNRINMNTVESSLKPILIECFEKIDKELMTKILNCDDIGSTCTLCFITKTKTNRIITVANLGDSHAYLVSNKRAIRLTSEHKCSNEDELVRLKEKNAIIYQNRMFGQLALTRAFCDRKHKPYGLLATPSISQQTIKEKPISQNAIADTETEYDLYLIVASDGVWDVTVEEDLMRMFVESANGKSTKQLARTLIDFSIDKGSTDNISLIVVRL